LFNPRLIACILHQATFSGIDRHKYAGALLRRFSTYSPCRQVTGIRESAGIDAFRSAPELQQLPIDVQTEAS
jgi:hypothetical protein